MTPKTDSPKWWFEQGDPSVGLFASQWVHEDCPITDADPAWTCEVNESLFYSERIDRYTTRRHFLIRCLDCGGTMWAIEDDFDPERDLVEEMAEQYREEVMDGLA